MCTSISVPDRGPGSVVRIPIPYCGEDLVIRCTYVVCLQSPELIAVHLALDALAAYVRQTGDEGVFPITDPTYILTRSDRLFVDTTDTHSHLTAGFTFHLAVCRVHVWENLHLTQVQMAAIFLEELLHCAYCINDETEVKRKVSEILRHIDPCIDFDTFYRDMPGRINLS